MEPLFEGLTASEIEYLQYLEKQGYYDDFEMTINEDSSSEYRVQKFIDGGYITLTEFDSPEAASKVAITGKGSAALVDFDKYRNQIQPLQQEIRSLNSIAEALKQQLEFAKQSAEDSRKDADSSKKLAKYSLIIAFIAALPVLIDILKVLVNIAQKLFATFSALTPHIR